MAGQHLGIGQKDIWNALYYIFILVGHAIWPFGLSYELVLELS